MQPPEVETVLVAVDGSDASAQAAAYAVAIADRYHGELAALFVHGRKDFEAVRTGAGEVEDLSVTAEAFLRNVRDEADESGIPIRTAVAYGFSTTQKLVHPGSVILDAADEFGADFLVIPRESLDDSTSEDVLAKAAEYALLYASQPVLSV